MKASDLRAALNLATATELDAELWVAGNNGAVTSFDLALWTDTLSAADGGNLVRRMVFGARTSEDVRREYLVDESRGKEQYVRGPARNTNAPENYVGLPMGNALRIRTQRFAKATRYALIETESAEREPPEAVVALCRQVVRCGFLVWESVLFGPHNELRAQGAHDERSVAERECEAHATQLLKKLVAIKQEHLDGKFDSPKRVGPAIANAVVSVMPGKPSKPARSKLRVRKH